MGLQTNLLINTSVPKSAGNLALPNRQNRKVEKAVQLLVKWQLNASPPRLTRLLRQVTRLTTPLSNLRLNLVTSKRTKMVT